MGDAGSLVRSHDGTPVGVRVRSDEMTRTREKSRAKMEEEGKEGRTEEGTALITSSWSEFLAFLDVASTFWLFIPRFRDSCFALSATSRSLQLRDFGDFGNTRSHRHHRHHRRELVWSLVVSFLEIVEG
jgi:hypothetical protein